MKNPKLKLKPIPKSLRENKRYFKIKLISESLFSEADLFFAIQNSLKQIFGLFGFSEIGFQLIFFEKNTLILGCNASAQSKLGFALLSLKEVNSKKLVFLIEQVSGTLKSLD